MDSVDQARSQAWRLWAKLAAPALLRCPVIGISAVLAVSTPLAAMARTLPRSQESASAEPTHRQLRVLHSYERYLSRMRAQTAKAGRAVKFAYRQVGKPYQWGGAGPRTYDCSGLVMAAWRKGGLRLPHRADLQHRMIRRKVSIKNLRPGDLVFFSGDHHVGIYVGRRHFLHAPHTGARVQRGTLTGWRLRSFAGAARPGAPAYHAWPHWVRMLADHHEHANAAHRPHGHAHEATPVEADGTALDPENIPEADAIPDPGDDTAGQAPGTDPALPPVAAPVPPVPTTSGTPGEDIRPLAPATPPAPVTSAPPATPPATPPAPEAKAPPAPSGIVARLPVHTHGGLALPLLTMSAHPARGRHHAVWADVPPAPQPREGGDPRTRRHEPRNSVQQRNDEQRLDRDFGSDSGGDDDVDSGNDGIDLRSLLGDVP